jgi:hypothetical protein
LTVSTLVRAHIGGGAIDARETGAALIEHQIHDVNTQITTTKLLEVGAIQKAHENRASARN